MSRNWQLREMTGEQFTTVHKALGLSQAAAGRFLGISERQARRYAADLVPIDPAHALLLRAMRHYGAIPKVPPWEGVRAKQAKEEAKKPSLVP